jgi:hypothetical protein
MLLDEVRSLSTGVGAVNCAYCMHAGLPPFWQIAHENGRQVYLNTITNSSTSIKPTSVHGGILADQVLY